MYTDSSLNDYTEKMPRTLRSRWTLPVAVIVPLALIFSFRAGINHGRQNPVPQAYDSYNNPYDEPFSIPASIVQEYAENTELTEAMNQEMGAAAALVLKSYAEHLEHRADESQRETAFCESGYDPALKPWAASGSSFKALLEKNKNAAARMPTAATIPTLEK